MKYKTLIGASLLTAGLAMRLQKNAKITAHNIENHRTYNKCNNLECNSNKCTSFWDAKEIDFFIGCIAGWIWCGIWYSIYFP